MRIRRLKLSGFKSFVDPAELHIEPGLTGIVGPNGCGKSNLLEAIRWVMGEGSPKSLRGSGMEDVIFAGTERRPARDFAEVAMLLDRPNADTAEADPEAEVVRRIERGAGSAYRINGRDVRQKDVALLFADAATGAHSPSLVSQNRIGAVIAAKPAERRQMLEEAAGIAGLHARRKDAEQKLRATEANLERLDEVLGEMEARGAALRRQARAAERYRSLSEQVRLAEARLIWARWRDAAVAAERAAREADQAERAVVAAAEAQRAAAAHAAEGARTLGAARAAATEAREAAQEAGHRLAALRTERQGIERRLGQLQRQMETLAQDRAREATLAEDAAGSLERLEAEAAELESRIGGAEARKGDSQRAVAEAQDRLAGAESALATALAEQAAGRAAAQIAASARAAAGQRLERARREAERLAQEGARLGEAAPLEDAIARAEAARGQAEADRAQAGAALAAAEGERPGLLAARDAAEAEGSAARAEQAALEGEARALTPPPRPSGKVAPLLDRLRAAPGYERALAAALGDDLEAPLGGDGARGWLGAEGAADPPLPAGAERLLDHVQAPAELARRLAQIGVVDTLGTEPLAAGQRLVTREGALRRWDGFFARDGGGAAAERLIRRNRLAAIEAALPEVRARAERAMAERNRAGEALTALARTVEQVRREQADAEARLRSATAEGDRAAVALERLAAARADHQARSERAASELAEAESAVAEAARAVAALPDEAGIVARVAERNAAAAAARREVADARAGATLLGQTIAADRERLAAARAEADSWRRRGAEAAKRNADIAARSAAAGEEAKALAEAPAALDAQVAEAERQAATGRSEAEGARQAEQAAEEAVRRLEAAATATGEALAAAREARAGAAARREGHEARRAELSRTSGERFDCPAAVLPERVGFASAEVGADDVEASRLERLTAERERLGPVNLVAEQELAELDETRTRSVAEREELGQAVNRLRGSIGSLNREGRARLLEAFEAVDGHFRRLFTRLFEGGQAHLALVDSDDPLEAGLEIMAQPPGKKLQSLTLLSGGEQALTAVALIFALFLTNPAPICVLDEVDAPLDDANIERFCDLLDAMTRETDTRYLIVTHNAVTMARMHRLFGVTMVERGVSRLVSVDLGGAETLLAAE